jgi:hypothetical protein
MNSTKTEHKVSFHIFKIPLLPCMLKFGQINYFFETSLHFILQMCSETKVIGRVS